MIFRQEISKAFYKHEGGYIGSYKTYPGSLIFRIIDKKPYIVGVQVQEREAHFITREMFEKISQVADDFIDVKKEK